jgi:hypothetical protein
MPELKTAWTAPETAWSMPGAGTFLDFRTLPEVLARAWLHQFALAFHATIDFDDVAALRAQRSAVLDSADDAVPVLAKVGTGPGNIWAFYRYSLEAQSETCIRPDDLTAAEPGRWVKQTLPSVVRCSTRRYYQHIEFCDQRTPVFSGDKNTTTLWTRCRGKTPALFMSFLNDEPEEKSQTQAFHRVEVRYKLRVLSANWRGGVEAQMTPPREEDAAADPGALRLIGDLRDLIIKDNRLWPQLGTALLRTRLGAHQPLFDRGPQRIVCDSLDITCIASVWTPNTPCELVSPIRIWLKLQDALGTQVGEENQLDAPPVREEA